MDTVLSLQGLPKLLTLSFGIIVDISSFRVLKDQMSVLQLMDYFIVCDKNTNEHLSWFKELYPCIRTRFSGRIIQRLDFDKIHWLSFQSTLVLIHRLEKLKNLSFHPLHVPNIWRQG